MQILPVSSPEDARRLHAELLTPAFPRTELVTADEFVAACGRESVEALVAVDADGVWAGTAVAEHFPAADVVLLTWLATSGATRSRGVGGALLAAGLRRWQERWQPAHVLGEVEAASAVPESSEHGDPAARLRFYARHGARLLDIPYVQPPIGPGFPRVPLHLLSLARTEEPRDDGAVAADPLRRWLTELFADEPRDAEVEAILASVTGDWVGSVPLAAELARAGDEDSRPA